MVIHLTSQREAHFFGGTNYFNRYVRILGDWYDLCISLLLWFLFFVVFVCLFFLQFKGEKLCATHHGIQSCLNHNMPLC